MDLRGEHDDYMASLQYAPNCLSMCRVNSTTLATYRNAVDEFLEFCQDRELTAYSRMRMDEHLALFGNTLFQESSRRGQRQLFVNAVMGVELLNPHLKGHLLRSRAVYAGWDKMSPGSSPPPVPVALLAVLVLHLRSNGNRTAALGILLAFHALLRIQELLWLTWEDVLLPGDCRLPHSSRSSGSGGVLIRVSKTGRLQFVALTDEKLLEVLAQEKPRFRQEDRVVSMSSADLSRLYQSAIQNSGCETLGYVFHSLRHGGATNMFLQGCEMATIQATGRWKQIRTCSVYVQGGRGLLLGTSFTASTLRSMDIAVRRLGSLQDF